MSCAFVSVGVPHTPDHANLHSSKVQHRLDVGHAVVLHHRYRGTHPQRAFNHIHTDAHWVFLVEHLNRLQHAGEDGKVLALLTLLGRNLVLVVSLALAQPRNEIDLPCEQ